VVNESFAATFWPGERPLGKRLRATDQRRPGEWRTVVGVVPNILQGDPLRQRFKPVVYVPLRQQPPGRRAWFLVRARVPQDHLAGAVRAEVEKLDPDVLLADLTTLKAHFAFDRDSMDAEHSELAKQAAVAPVFALIAMLLAAVGLYAVIAHSVSQRTREIGVRMAIGAAVEDIRNMVLCDGMLPVAIGMILGLATSLAVNRILQSQLVGVSPHDPVAMAGAPVVLILVALLASLIPARRAMNVDPAVALRHD
jgi:putative ABC transport system permease protein